MVGSTTCWQLCRETRRLQQTEATPWHPRPAPAGGAARSRRQWHNPRFIHLLTWPRHLRSLTLRDWTVPLAHTLWTVAAHLRRR
ncbi:hypothetical protein ACKKBF_B40770 [Auxenochlorella protothecoides x Auxenochlorella symbiontica]